MKSIALAAGVSLLGLFVWDLDNEPGDDEQIIAAVRTLPQLERVTAQPFKMDPAASSLCRAPANVKPAINNPHGDYYCHVFVSKPGLEAMQSGKGAYPTGTTIVKQKFAEARGKTVELYTLMRKMESGYDPEHGDWEYSIVNRHAKQVLTRGRLESCIECHKAYEKTDFVTRLYLPPVAVVEPVLEK